MPHSCHGGPDRPASGRDASTVVPESVMHDEKDERVVDAPAFSPRALDQDEKENAQPTSIVTTTRTPSGFFPGNTKWRLRMTWRVGLFGRGMFLAMIYRSLILQMVSHNPRRGVLMLREAIQAFPTDSWSFVELGTVFASKFAEYGRSLRCFALAAQRGSAVGMLCLGDQYVRGLGVTRDLALGWRLVDKARLVLCPQRRIKPARGVNHAGVRKADYRGRSRHMKQRKAAHKKDGSLR
mmetsp:Transcript_6483/g.15710  ORF Transcript_6483/g.15710 Transcript_6483/m.15710 type:complete len:238 (+) Transcript_6483:42-755(+)